MNIEERLHELRELAKKFAKSEANRVYLEEFKKSQLAILMKKYEKSHKTAAAQEREARADQEYLSVLEGLKQATEHAQRARWELKIAELGASVWQTSQANRRQEMKSLNSEG